MKQLSLLLIGISILLYSACKTQPAKEHKFASFKQLDDSITVLYESDQLNETIELLESHKGQFPEKLYRANWYLIHFNTEAKRYKKALDLIREAVEQNKWYGISPDSEFFGPLRKLEGYDAIIAKNDQLKKQAQLKAKPETLVELPSDYSPDKKYPLFIALHGWGEDVPFFKEHWHSELLKKKFIVLYIQSSQMVRMDGFAWTDTELANKEITGAYADILKKYSIDEQQIIIGGFSQGAKTSINICVQNLIPARGFISLCPPKLTNMTPELVLDMKNRGLQGVILTGEKDPSLTGQKEMMAQFDSLAFPCNFVIEKGLGHWFPDDLNKKIEDGISEILNRL